MLWSPFKFNITETLDLEAESIFTAYFKDETIKSKGVTGWSVAFSVIF